MGPQCQIPTGTANSYNTELETIALLGAAALAVGRVHGVMLMVEVGDSREGLLLRDLPAFVSAVHRHSGLRLDGVGVNFACLSGVPPTTAALLYLCAAIATAESASGIRIPQLSGGNSASLPLLLTGPDHARVNNLRLGESILLGCEPVSGRLINGLSDTAFGLVAEVIESSHKSHRVTVVTTTGPVDTSNQVVLALGSQDTDIQGLGFPSGVYAGRFNQRPFGAGYREAQAHGWLGGGIDNELQRTQPRHGRYGYFQAPVRQATTCGWRCEASVCFAAGLTE